MSKVMIIQKMQPLVVLIFKDIELMYYRIDKETSEEYVTVVRKWDIEHGTRTLDICVTADSDVAIVDDVWNRLKREFG